jgi:hypothetical protein
VSKLSSGDFITQFAEEPDASRLDASVGFRIGRD